MAKHTHSACSCPIAFANSLVQYVAEEILINLQRIYI
jgi:hypothetical protein